MKDDFRHQELICISHFTWVNHRPWFDGAFLSPFIIPPAYSGSKQTQLDMSLACLAPRSPALIILWTSSHLPIDSTPSPTLVNLYVWCNNGSFKQQAFGCPVCLQMIFLRRERSCWSSSPWSLLLDSSAWEFFLQNQIQISCQVRLSAIAWCCCNVLTTSLGLYQPWRWLESLFFLRLLFGLKALPDLPVWLIFIYSCILDPGT